MESIPQAAIDLLSFSEEPMSLWKKDTDIRAFAEALYPPDKPSYGRDMCSEEEKLMREYARSFTKNLMEARHSSTYLDFYQDAFFGQVAKYTISMKCCIRRLLEDAGFYSLAHLLESESDLECSLLLASNFYYKQAAQMLRNVLEEVFLPIHFCDTVRDFDAWKANSFRTPKLRGNDGLIKRLLKKNIIPDPLGKRIADLYGNLSGYVHGSQSTLMHQNMHLGEWPRVEFSQNTFTTWNKLFCECVDVCVRLLKINYDQWRVIRSLKFETLAIVGKTLCHTCHNEDAFDRWFLSSKYIYTKRGVEGQETTLLENVEDLSFYCYICQRCGKEIIVNANETPLTIVICFSTDGLFPKSTVTNYTCLVRGTQDPYCEWYNVLIEGADTNIISSLRVRPIN